MKSAGHSVLNTERKLTGPDTVADSKRETEFRSHIHKADSKSLPTLPSDADLSFVPRYRRFPTGMA
jgi:hypothetical protein